MPTKLILLEASLAMSTRQLPIPTLKPSQITDLSMPGAPCAVKSGTGRSMHPLAVKMMVGDCLGQELFPATGQTTMCSEARRNPLQIKYFSVE